MIKQKIRRASMFALAFVMMLSMGQMAFAEDAIPEQVMQINTSELSLSGEPEFRMTDDDSALTAERSVDAEQEVISHRTSVSDLEGGTELVAESRAVGVETNDDFSVNNAMPTAGDFYFSITSFLTQPQEWSYLIVDVFPGEVLHVQMDSPNCPNIDYDLFLYRFVGNFLVSVDSSTLWTQINGAYGTLSEIVGWINNTNSIQTMAIIVESIIGYSTTLPFTLHVAANVGFEPFEVDAITRPRVFALGHDETRTGIMDTRADNDWFRILVPENRDFDFVNISLDAASVSSGHVVEMYRFLNSQAHKVAITDGTAPVTTGNHYIRVHNNSAPLTGVEYQLTITTSDQLIEPFEPSISVYTTYDVVETGEQFEVFGYVDIDEPSTIDFQMIQQSTGGIQDILLGGEIDGSGRFSFGWLHFTDGFDEGIYVFRVILRNNNSVEVDRAYAEIEHVIPIPLPNLPTRVSNVVFAPSSIVTYWHGPLPRVNRLQLVTISGLALDASNSPVSDAQLTLRIANLAWTNPDMRYSIVTTRTCQNGRFEYVVRMPEVFGRYQFTWGTAQPRVHHYDLAEFRVQNENRDWLIIPESHQELYILGWTTPA